MPQRELIVVELRNGTVCRMVKKGVNMLLARNEIARFVRSGKWVVVGEDPLRDMEMSNPFTARERRAMS